MSNSAKLNVIRLTDPQLARIVELLIKAGELGLAQKVLAQATKARG